MAQLVAAITLHYGADPVGVQNVAPSLARVLTLITYGLFTSAHTATTSATPRRPVLARDSGISLRGCCGMHRMATTVTAKVVS